MAEVRRERIVTGGFHFRQNKIYILLKVRGGRRRRRLMLLFFSLFTEVRGRDERCAGRPESARPEYGVPVVWNAGI